MADLFDALVARALGSTPPIAPVVPPRFAEPSELSEVTALRDADPPFGPGGQAANGTEPGRSEAPGDATHEISVERRSGMEGATDPAGPAHASAVSELGRAVTPHHRRSATTREPRSGGPRAGEWRVGEPRSGAARDGEPYTSQPRVDAESAGGQSADGPSTGRPSVGAASGGEAWVGGARADGASLIPAPDGQALETPSDAAGATRQGADQPAEIAPGAGSRPTMARQDSVISGRRLPGAEEREADGGRPQVTISIGQVEVRAPAKPEPVRVARSEPPRRPEPRLSLDEYLRRGQRR